MKRSASNPERLLEELASAAIEDRARVLQAHGGDERAQLDALIEYAAQLTAVDAARAAQATDIVVNLADRLGSKLMRARARRARGRALAYAGRFDEALFACDEGVRLAEEAGEAMEAGRARLASMHALGELGRLDDAIRAGETARRAFLDAGESELAARADINIGTAYQRRDDAATAVACFDRARPALAAQPLMLGHLENNRGEALIALNDFEGAEAAFAAALAAFERADATLTAAIAEGNLADLAARQGRLQRAMLHFERARRRFEADAAPGHLARLRAEQADAMSVLGMPAAAIPEYEAALVELDRCGLRLEAGRARHGMGMALLRLAHPARAETALAAAATAFDELGHARARARVDLVRAELAAGHGRLAEARAMALRALAILHDRPADAIAARLLLATLALGAERLDEADAELSHALAAARELDLAPLLADVRLARGRLARRRGQPGPAIDEFSQAVAQIERVRGALQAERFRAAFLGDRTAAYEALAAALLDRGDADSLARAFAVIEQAKGRMLLEHVMSGMTSESREHDTSVAEAVDPGERILVERLGRAHADLNALYSRLHDGGDALTRATPHAWRDAVRARERTIDEVEARLATTRTAGGLYAGPGMTLAEAQRWCVGDDDALIEYAIVEGELLAIVLTHGKATAFRRLATAAELNERIDRVRFQINRALRPGSVNEARRERLLADVRTELGDLNALILAPLRDALAGASRLLIVPHGPLHVLPFAALWDGESYLIERYEVCLAPSASLLAKLAQRATRGRDDANHRVLVVGVADEGAPRIEAEARMIADQLGPGATLLLGPDATTSAVAAAAADTDVLHFACHGRFDPELPNASGLHLADRWLTVRELQRLRLRARLVTLSGCETGLSRVQAGDELMGLLRPLLAAGASSVLASLWRVDDAETAQLMRTFYEYFHSIHGPARPAAALRAAQQAALTNGVHPALWAAFFVMGKS